MLDFKGKAVIPEHDYFIVFNKILNKNRFLKEGEFLCRGCNETYPSSDLELVAAMEKALVKRGASPLPKGNYCSWCNEELRVRGILPYVLVEMSRLPVETPLGLPFNPERGTVYNMKELIEQMNLEVKEDAEDDEMPIEPQIDLAHVVGRLIGQRAHAEEAARLGLKYR